MKIVCLPGFDITKFEINLIFLIKPLIHDPKDKTKT